MRCDVLIYTKAFNYWFPVGIVVIAVQKVLIIVGMYKVLTVRRFIPFHEKRRYLISYRYAAYTIFRLASDYIEVPFFKSSSSDTLTPV